MLFIETKDIDDNNPKRCSARYKSKEYIISNKRVRVTNDWYKRNIPYLKEYFTKNNIVPISPIESNETISITKSRVAPIHRVSSRQNSRYKGNAIGNAQNRLIRNILSNLGNESFNESDWQQTKQYFDNKCVYCGKTDDLVIEHAIPINKEKLGEYRIGNIVPACTECNKTNFRPELIGRKGGVHAAPKRKKSFCKNRHLINLHYWALNPLINIFWRIFMKKRVFIGLIMLIIMLCVSCATAGPVALDPVLPLEKTAAIYWSQSGYNFYPTAFNDIELKTKKVLGWPILADGTYLVVPEGTASVEGTIYIMDVSWSNDGYRQVKTYNILSGIYQFTYTFKAGMTYFVEPYIDEKQVLNVKIYDEIGKKYYLPPKKDSIAIVPVKEIKRIQ